MFKFNSDSRYTNHLHYMVSDKIQVAIWDLLGWLECDYEVDSLHDVLRYVRLIADYGEPHQGMMFFELIRDNKQLINISSDIAERYIKRGRETGQPWLMEFGEHIKGLHAGKKAVVAAK
jgi:hypothetical protein